MKKLIKLLLALLSCFVFMVGCSTTNTATDASTNTTGNDTEEVVKSMDDKEISIGTTSGGVSEKIVNLAVKDLEEMGYNVEVTLFNDFNTPNTALAEGSIDCNLYQHEPFLNEFNKNNGTDLVVADDTGVYVMKHGLYSDTLTSIDQVEEGMKIGIYSDNSNRKRSLEMLEEVGLIEYDKSVEFPTLLDITENSLNLDFTEMEGRALLAAYEDFDVITCAANDWVKIGRDPNEALHLVNDESGKEILATRPELVDTQKIIDMQSAINTEAVRNMLEEEFKGACEPTF